jgi:serine/threonine protein kinase
VINTNKQTGGDDINSDNTLFTTTTTKNRRLRDNFDGSAAKATSPTPVWMPEWEWLPGFSGTNGPVLKLMPGRQAFDSYILIAGQFTNQPPLLLWREVTLPASNAIYRGYGNTTVLGGEHRIYGTISSIAEVFLPYEVPPSPPSITTYPRDYTFVVLLACVGVGILMGLGFTASCFSKLSYPTQDGINEYYDAMDESGGRTNSLGPFSLKTLCDTQGTIPVDFKECFDRAMKTRHLPTYEALVVINPKEILLSRIIGEGSFGRVWSGQWRNNSVAVKEFVFAQAAIAGGSLQRNNIIEEIVGEAGVMACLRHPKILQLYGCSLTMQAIWIVSELCIRGSLKMVLMDQSLDLPIIKKLSICMDIADGMQYLHNRTPPIIHRDLKSHNIFISEPSPGHFVAKIGDWGSARAVALTGSKNMTQGVGTACWLSPEVINNAHFSKYSDIYAFGIILWEVYTRQEIYEGLSAAQIIAKVANDGLRPVVPKDCPWTKIMTDCWKQEPVGRPSFQAVLIALSKIYLKVSAKNKGKISANVSNSNISDEVILDEHHPLLEVKSQIRTTPQRPPRPPPIDARLESPETIAAKKRIREYNLDSFHPSMENNGGIYSGDSGAIPRDIFPISPFAQDAITHSAPVLVQTDLTVPAFYVADDDGNLVSASAGSSRNNSRANSRNNSNTDNSFQYEMSMSYTADPIDFLFSSHKPKQKRGQSVQNSEGSNSYGTIASVADKEEINLIDER